MALSGDVVEEQRLGQRNDTLAWFWHIGTTNDEQGNEWMDEREWWSWLTSGPIHKALQVYTKAWMDRWKKKSHWSRMKQGGCSCGWSTIGTSRKEGKKEWTRGFERTCLLCLEAGVDVARMLNEAMDVYSRLCWAPMVHELIWTHLK